LNKQLTKSKSFYIIPCFVVSHANWLIE
jgi:hypothetical protein